jgi:hypothetical protein
MATAQHDDDNDGDDVVTLEGNESEQTTVEDNGNTPDTPEQIAAAEAARVAALRQVAGDEDDDTKPPKMIPKGRFDEVNERMKALAAQNDQLIAALASGKAAAPAPAAEPPPPAFDLRAAIKAKNEALATGDDDKALDLEMAIEQHRLEVAEAAALRRIAEDNAQREANAIAADLKAAGDEIKAQYPQLDGKSAEANEDAIVDVIAMRDARVARGVPAGDALRQAAAQAAKLYGFEAVGGDNKPSPTSAAETARTIAARTRNAAAARQQPPELNGVGNRASKPKVENVEEMSEEAFAALPLDEKKRLRGDM